MRTCCGKSNSDNLLVHARRRITDQMAIEQTAKYGPRLRGKIQGVQKTVGTELTDFKRVRACVRASYTPETSILGLNFKGVC